ncbi:MAG: glycosyltransferase family 4 protein [Candidatus Binatia bacterium]|nr:glycosyltransferase family 4 protein [Candidatus Binatia bacterium]
MVVVLPLMRIVQVVQGLPPDSVGGTETYVWYLSRELARCGHEVRVFARVANPHKEEYEVEEVWMDGLAVTRINNTLRDLDGFPRSYANPDVAGAFGALLDAFAPDVVHFHHLMYLSTTCIHEATRRNIPVVMTLHDYWLICQRGRFLTPDLSLCPGQTDEGCARCFAHLLHRGFAPVYRRLKPFLRVGTRLRDGLRRLHGRYTAHRPPPSYAVQQIQQRMAHIRDLCQQVTLFLAPSQFLRQQFLAFGIPPHKILFWECGLPQYATAAVEQKVPRPPLVFAYIGMVDAVKGVHLLVEAFAPLTGAELRIYGREADYAPYPNRGRFLALLRSSPHIRLMGPYENHEVGRILTEVDVVVVPSIWYENAPLVIREAFLARKPVITAAFGGMQEWVQDGVNGLLFAPRDVEDLRRQLQRCIAEPELVQRLAAHCPSVKSIAEDARELIARYAALRENCS